MFISSRKVSTLVACGVFVVLASCFFPHAASAHQPRLTEQRTTIVPDPEVSKAYYATLQGEPDVYVIDAKQSFDLYVNVLVPDIKDQPKDLIVTVIKNRDYAVPMVKLDGPTFVWTRFYEEFGADWYWKGPEYKARAEAGTYEIRVSSPTNTTKYALAIGEIEAFDAKEGWNAMVLIPQLKRTFFEKSPIDYLRSPFGWGLIVVMEVLGFLFGFLYRVVLKKMAKHSPRGLSKNINTNGRWLRFAFGVGLLLLAIFTTWSPLLLFFSGFCFFEAIFSWCGFYAAIGKNTCPMN